LPRTAPHPGAGEQREQIDAFALHDEGLHAAEVVSPA